MTNLQRLTGKTFGETATATGDDPEIGQFGSAKAGTYIGTTDVATIQSLPAWSNGFIDAVTPSTQFPPLPEVTGAMKVLSYQENYLLQKGIAEWDSGTTYYAGDFCKGIGEGRLYYSKIDNNTNNALTDSNSWEEFAPVSSYNYDGQWHVLTSPVILSTATSTGVYSINLGPRLPSDGYTYEVLFSAQAVFSSSSYTTVYIETSQNIIIYGHHSDSSNSDSMVNNFTYPISNRTPLMVITGANLKTFNLRMIGYRRVGTNV